MKNKKKIQGVYLIADFGIIKEGPYTAIVESAIESGIKAVQLRDKDSDALTFYKRAEEIKKITSKYDVPLIINDRVDIAIAIDADGVHVGQKDLPVEKVREILGDGKIIGVSASNLVEGIQGEKGGADYLGVGSLFTTTTKKDTRKVTIQMLKRIKNEVKIPVIAIGGINKNNLEKIKGIADGVAVASAILKGKDIKRDVLELVNLFG
ncbi:thiamine-phosphate pyrophosphorylase [Anaerobranca californiensis DSM 14826]|jgi:thiamine-phosphate pyrophosphorylase|uniref:Thiamine-phosphate synthase n=1 Tax=Anaerobranca californiensis DSM 14826 TaxID=1120989 RepID=A0A1M6QGD1_9FIRM|nr:thiamine phosphate synthase [Anaerobranca californiensis]SHK19276.1 thiamine-phosphate pyrophosphorylase [Anaerobranca californiensis DSM 14826]